MSYEYRFVSPAIESFLSKLNQSDKRGVSTKYTSDVIELKDNSSTHNWPYDVRLVRIDVDTVLLEVVNPTYRIYELIDLCVGGLPFEIYDIDDDENVSLTKVFRQDVADREGRQKRDIQ